MLSLALLVPALTAIVLAAVPAASERIARGTAVAAAAVSLVLLLAV